MNRKNVFFILVGLLAILMSCQTKTYDFETEHLQFSVDETGFVHHLKSTGTSVDYLPEDQKAPLLSLYKDSAYILPQKALWDEESRVVVLSYPNGSEARIQIQNKGDYLRLELVSLEPRNDVKVVVWGPYPTIIDQMIGETVCVVRDSHFAIGLQSLEINTIEGIPDDGDNAGGGQFIDPLPGQELPDSLADRIGERVNINVNISGDLPEYVRQYRGSAAVKKPWGSELRLFARDRRESRIIGSGDDIQQVQAVDVDLTGSAIALFGCPEPKILDVIETIELEEGLPHPEFKGKWIKRSDEMNEPYLMAGGDFQKAMEYAKVLGFKRIHMGDFFESWGHFGLKTDRFPNGAEDIRKITERAREEGIFLGVHTLTTFTTKNDPYVSPVPSDSLCKRGSSTLSKDVNENDDVIFIEDPRFFRNTGMTHTAKIGKELLNYRKVSDEEPWRLLDCERGVYGTEKSAHKSGETIDKLINSSYRGFHPDIFLQDKYAYRLAEVCNATGLDMMDFDGFGGGSPGGHGAYGAARFITEWYENLDRYRITCGAGTFHYYWHIYAFMNWGEPWYDALRESQVNYRIENQRYFERNLMPHMLGWFSLHPHWRPEEVEWIQSLSAGFDAGYLLRVDNSFENNGFRDQIFESIRQWQKARRGDAFSEEQIKLLKDPKQEFHLEKTGEKSWNLYPVSLKGGFKHEYMEVQPGQPVESTFDVNNPHPGQPVKFYLSVPGKGDQNISVSNIVLDFNNFQTLKIPGPVKGGQHVMCDGEGIYLCDQTWNKLEQIDADKLPSWEKGNNKITVQSDFSGEEVSLEMECKFVGEPMEARVR